MSESNITNDIYNYVIKNNISITQICKDTDISLDKIIKENRKLSATELLEICRYLNIQPEQI